MGLFIDSFLRAVASCMHPRVIVLSLLPLLLIGALSLTLGYFFWDAAVNWVSLRLESWELLKSGWLAGAASGRLKTVVAPLVLVVAVTPIVVVLSLLIVAALMAPALVSLVAARRFPQLQRKGGGSMTAGLLWSLGSTLMALIALIISIPLWVIPPLILILPPLIWGWLTYRVMTFDALADHASKEERRMVVRRHRAWLLAMGVVTGYLGAAPSIVWASGLLFAAAFVVLVPVAVWIYTMVFAFSALWFSHYCLAALDQQRGREATAGSVVPAPVASGDVQHPAP